MEIDMRILAIVLFAGIVFVCVLLILLISTVHICDVSRGKKRRRMPDTREREIVFDVDEDEAEDNAEDDETGNGDLLLEPESEIEQKEEGELPVIEVRKIGRAHV